MDTSWHPDKCSRLFGERTKIKNDKHGVLYRSDKLCDKWDYMNIFLQAKLLPVKLDTCHSVLYVLLNEMMHCSWSHWFRGAATNSFTTFRFPQDDSIHAGTFTGNQRVWHCATIYFPRQGEMCCGLLRLRVVFVWRFYACSGSWVNQISRTLGFVAKWKGSKGNSRSLDCGSSSTFRNYSMLMIGWWWTTWCVFYGYDRIRDIQQCAVCRPTTLWRCSMRNLA